MNFSLFVEINHLSLLKLHFYGIIANLVFIYILISASQLDQGLIINIKTLLGLVELCFERTKCIRDRRGETKCLLTTK